MKYNALKGFLFITLYLTIETRSIRQYTAVIGPAVGGR